VRCLEAGMAFVDGAIGQARFSQVSRPVRELPKTASFPGLHPFHVDADSPADRQAIVRGAPCHLSGIGTGDEGGVFRGGAPRV
jgi:hypothetical protein